MRKTSIACLFFTILCFFVDVLAEEVVLMQNDSTIEFAKILEYEVDLAKHKAASDLVNTYLSIKVKVKKNKDCNTKGCNHPLSVYGKLNSKPLIESLDFDKKDDLGDNSASDTLTYGFDYSPCIYKDTDKLFLKLVGVEGKSAFSISVSYDSLSYYKVICSDPVIKDDSDSKKQSIRIFKTVSTKFGTFRFGGYLEDASLSNDLFLLTSSLKWQKVSLDGDDKPVFRLGHYFGYHDQFIILFGGVNIAGETLNDLWIYNFKDKKWLEITGKYVKKQPEQISYHSGEIMNKHGLIVFFGGKNPVDSQASVITVLNLNVLYDIYYTINTNEVNLVKKELWYFINVEKLSPRYSLSINSISDDEIMLFGGFDLNNNAVKTTEIFNIVTKKVTVVDSVYNTFPEARGGHSILSVGSILFLYGGKRTDLVPLNDAWKFIISKKKWVKVSEKKMSSFFLARSGMNFVKVPGIERPALYGGEFKDKDLHYNDLIVLNFPVCKQGEEIEDSVACIPCLEGHVISEDKDSCSPCSIGTYHSFDRTSYFDSKCENCPQGTYNKYQASSTIFSCNICEFGSFNDNVGQSSCQTCDSNSVCLPGAKKALIDSSIKDHLDDLIINEDNHPKIFNYQDEEKELLWKYHGSIIVLSITLITIFFVIIFYTHQKMKFTKYLIELDFIPITGGRSQKCSGGVITLFYIILITSLTAVFFLRFIYYNELVEVIPISYTNQSHVVKLSSVLSVELVGYDGECINPEKILSINQGVKTYGCSDNIEITRVDALGKIIYPHKMISCSVEDYCKVTFLCEDCKLINNNDKLVIMLKQQYSYIQLFKWNFESVWGETLDKEIYGYSKISGIFRPSDNIGLNYVFKGKSPSAIDLYLTPIYYNNKYENINLSGYRADYKAYSKGGVKDMYNFYNEDGVTLEIRFEFTTNFFEINIKKRIEILDFAGFILGMLAGGSFLSRVTKNICEDWGILDISIENYDNFVVQTLEKERKIEEKKEKDVELRIVNDRKKEKLNLQKEIVSTAEVTATKYESDTTAKYKSDIEKK